MAGARGTCGIAYSFKSTTAFGVAARIRSVNCRSVASTAASGMLLTRPMLTQFGAFSSRPVPARPVCPARPVSRKSAIGVLPVPLFGRDQGRTALLRHRERLIEVGDDVIDVFDADAEPDHFRPHASLLLLLR